MPSFRIHLNDFIWKNIKIEISTRGNQNTHKVKIKTPIKRDNKNIYKRNNKNSHKWDNNEKKRKMKWRDCHQRKKMIARSTLLPQEKKNQRKREEKKKRLRFFS